MLITRRRCKSISCEHELTKRYSQKLKSSLKREEINDNSEEDVNNSETDSIKYIDDSIDNSDLSSETNTLSIIKENDLKKHKKSYLSKSVPVLNESNNHKNDDEDNNKVSFVYNVDLYQQNESIIAKIKEINSEKSEHTNNKRLSNSSKKTPKVKKKNVEQEPSESNSSNSISSTCTSSISSSLSSINEFFSSNLEPLEIKELNDIVKRLSICSPSNDDNDDDENTTLKLKYENAKRERKLEEERIENDRKRLQEILTLCNNNNNNNASNTSNNENIISNNEKLSNNNVQISSSSSSSSCSSFSSTNANIMLSNDDNTKLNTIPELNLVKSDTIVEINDDSAKFVNDLQLRLILNEHKSHIDTFNVTFFKISDEINITGETICKVEYELNRINSILSNDKDNLEQIKSIKRHILDEAKRKYEDLEFQLMELEAKYECEMEDVHNRLLSEQDILLNKRQLALLQRLKQEQFELEKLKFNLGEKFKGEREKLKKIQAKLKQLEENLLNGPTYSNQQIDISPLKTPSKSIGSFNLVKYQQSKLLNSASAVGSASGFILPIQNQLKNYNNDEDDDDVYDQVPSSLHQSPKNNQLVVTTNEFKIHFHKPKLPNDFSNLLINNNSQNNRNAIVASNLSDYSLSSNNIVIENQAANANYELNESKLSQESVTLRIKKQNKQSIKETRPLTRYLPVKDNNFDLKQHVETSGHQLDAFSKLIQINKHSCRGYLFKMGKKFKTWNKRWFVFDRLNHTLSYYSDRQEIKQRGSILFRSINEVYVDHMRTVKSLDSKATFVVKTKERDYFFVAPTPEVMRIWVDVIFTGAEGYLEQ